MEYKVRFGKDALKDISRIDKPQREFIFAWIEKNLEGTKDPRSSGKPLRGDLKGSWRYRVGSYRLVANIKDDVLTVTIIAAGDRKSIYRTLKRK
jgi:mRNA interferase RelE/StbE